MSKASVVFVGEPDISRLSRFIETTGWRLIKRGEEHEKNGEISGRIGNALAGNNRVLLRQSGMENSAGTGNHQHRDDRSGYQDDANSGGSERKRLTV